jgi:small subunit ribosomal protein S16
MALKIRLRQQGRNNRPFYRVVVADVRSPRDGKYVEALGWYNPFETQPEKSLCLHPDRIQYWVQQGAEISDNVQSLMKRATPSLLKEKTAREIAKRAKTLSKKKARKERAPKAA